MNHSFNIDHAKKYGIEEAIVIENFIFWIKKNEANGKHSYAIKINETEQVRTFTYNSAKAMSDLFPYMNEKKIYRVMESLVEQGVLIKGNFNSNTYDRTLWYAFIDENAFLEKGNSISQNREMEKTSKEFHFPKSGNHDTDINQIINKNKEEESSPSEKVLVKKKEESSFVNQMLDLKNVVSSPVLNRQEAFQRIVNTISRIKKREKGQLVGYDSMNKNETANLYCLVDQFEGNENVVLQILETMLEYQKSGKLKLYSEILRATTKHTNPNFWNQATISAFYIVKFASDKEVIDAAIQENEIYQEHQKRKKENAAFAKSPEAKINIPIDPEFMKKLQEAKDKVAEPVDEFELKRKSDLEKLKNQISATAKKSESEIKEEENSRRNEILEKIGLALNVG